MTTLEDETTLEACLDAEEEALVAAGKISVLTENKSDDFLALPTLQVAMDDIQTVIRSERDED